MNLRSLNTACFNLPKNRTGAIASMSRLSSLTILLVLGSGLAIAIRSAAAQSSSANPANNLFVTTLAGIITAGYADGVGVSARFNGPLGIAVDKNDNVIVADFRNARIRRITPDGNVSTIAGSGTGFVDGVGIYARFNSPTGVAVNKEGNIVVADYGNNRIRLLTPEGKATTIAGSGIYGTTNGARTIARFAKPSGVTADQNGNLYVLDSGTSLVRRIDPQGVVTTLAGGLVGYADGTGNAAAFNFAGGAPQPALDKDGNVIIADFINSRLRSITPGGLVSTIAGGGSKKDGPALEATFTYPVGVARDLQGNLIIADWSNSQVRKYDVTTKTVTTLAGTGVQGDANGAAQLASFYRPAGVAVDSKGNIYVSDYFGNAIRKISGYAPKPLPSPTPVVSPSPTPIPSPSPTPNNGGNSNPSPANPTPATPVNLIYNPSFETGDFSGWRIYTYFVGDGGAFAQRGAAFASDGDFALQLKASGRILVDSCSQDLNLPPGDYVLSCDVTPSIGTKASLVVNYNDGTPALAVSSSNANQRSTLTLKFSVKDTSRPVTIAAVGDQRRYVRSNFIVDNFKLYRQ
jgi:sugar lactone lactonase YvrE